MRQQGNFDIDHSQEVKRVNSPTPSTQLQWRVGLLPYMSIYTQYTGDTAVDSKLDRGRIPTFMIGMRERYRRTISHAREGIQYVNKNSNFIRARRARASAMLLFCGTLHVRRYTANSSASCSMCGLAQGKTTELFCAL